jgi:5-methylcytosine-specific restriction protein A
MPTLPSNQVCAEFNCKEPRSRRNSFCLAHGGKDVVPSRVSDRRYDSPAWQSIRRRQLSIQPLCQACLTRGHVHLAEHVDHLFPWNVVGDESFVLNIFQSLCKPCHSHKTALEQRGIIEHYDAIVNTYEIGDYPYLVNSAQKNSENP